MSEPLDMHMGLKWLHRIYWRLFDLREWGEANWLAREDVSALIVLLLSEGRRERRHRQVEESLN